MKNVYMWSAGVDAFYLKSVVPHDLITGRSKRTAYVARFCSDCQLFIDALKLKLPRKNS